MTSFLGFGWLRSRKFDQSTRPEASQIAFEAGIHPKERISRHRTRMYGERPALVRALMVSVRLNPWKNESAFLPQIVEG